MLISKAIFLKQMQSAAKAARKQTGFHGENQKFGLQQPEFGGQKSRIWWSMSE
jgi:hypothetical protein